jgi:AP endonuclease-2
MCFEHRPANFGTRIDYILISQGLLPWFNKADIRADIMGSDHCPVYADFWNTLPDEDDKRTNIMDFLGTSTAIIIPYLAANYPEFKQKKLSTFFNSKKTGVPTDPTPSPSPSPSSSSAEASPFKRKMTSSSSPTTKRQNQNTIKSFFSAASSTKPSATPKPAEDEDDLAAILEQIDERHESTQGWSTLFQTPTIPSCQVHQCKCTEHTVNKKGPNQGRRFYLCSK